MKKRLFTNFLVLTVIMGFIGIINPNTALAYSKTATISTPKTITFKSKVNGSADINIKSDIKVDVTIYKKTIFFKKKIQKKSNVKNWIYNAKLSGSNTYIVKVKIKKSNLKSSKPSKLTCKITQHVDQKKGYKSGIWESSYISSPQPTIMHYDTIMYFPADECSILTDILDDDKYYTYKNTAWSIGLTALSEGLSFYVPAGKLTEKGLKVFMHAFSISSGLGMLSPNFREEIKNEVKKKGGYNSSTHKYSNGISIEYYYIYSTGLRYERVKKWNGKVMKGALGENGKWTKLEKR